MGFVVTWVTILVVFGFFGASWRVWLSWLGRTAAWPILVSAVGIAGTVAIAGWSSWALVGCWSSVPCPFGRWNRLVFWFRSRVLLIVFWINLGEMRWFKWTKNQYYDRRMAEIVWWVKVLFILANIVVDMIGSFKMHKHESMAAYHKTSCICCLYSSPVLNMLTISVSSFPFRDLLICHFQQPGSLLWHRFYFMLITIMSITVTATNQHLHGALFLP